MDQLVEVQGFAQVISTIDKVGVAVGDAGVKLRLQPGEEPEPHRSQRRHGDPLDSHAPDAVQKRLVEVIGQATEAAGLDERGDGRASFAWAASVRSIQERIMRMRGKRCRSMGNSRRSSISFVSFFSFVSSGKKVYPVCPVTPPSAAVSGNWKLGNRNLNPEDLLFRPYTLSLVSSSSSLRHSNTSSHSDTSFYRQLPAGSL